MTSDVVKARRIEAVRRALMSPRGDRIAIQHQEGPISILDAASGATCWELRTGELIEISASGTTVVVRQGTRLKGFDTITGGRLWTISIPVFGVMGAHRALGPDGDFVIINRDGEHFEQVAVPSGGVMRRWGPFRGGRVTVSLDGTQLGMCATDLLDSGEIAKARIGGDTALSCQEAAYVPRSIDFAGEREIIFWDDGELAVDGVALPGPSVRAFQLIRNGSVLVALHKPSLLVQWDVAARTPRGWASLGEAPVFSFSICDAGQQVAWQEGGDVCFGEVEWQSSPPSFE